MIRWIAILSVLSLLACKPEAPAEPGPAQGSGGAASHERKTELRLPLGRLRIGATTLEVVQVEHAVPGGNCEVFARPVEGPPSVATRVWIGTEDGVGSAKALVHEESDGPHAHLEIRADFDPARHQIWIELERPDGARESGSIPTASRE